MPVHRVTIPRPFAVGVFELTQAEWRSVMGSNPRGFMGDRNPVEKVSWDGAKNFVRRLSAKTGKEYRLLSEAEWEYVARAGSRTKYPWGNGIDKSKAKYDSSDGTRPVGSYGANAFGLYDTVGNVWEWTEDCWNESYDEAPSNGKAWTTGNCRNRVLRGGSWNYNPGIVRSANRNGNYSGFRTYIGGFRVARTLSPQETTLSIALKRSLSQIASVRPAPIPQPSSPVRPAAGIFPKTYKPRDTFKDCRDCPQMVVVPAGSFDMGDLNGDGDDSEKPVHRVTIPRPFAAGVYEVTQAEWRSLMGNSPSRFRGDRNPVEEVSWDDAKNFVRRLSAKTGKEYRLLSEAEWEYAARAGSRTKYPRGDRIDSSMAKYDGRGGTRRAGSYGPNAFGLYDTVGNVWEWTEDCWNRSYSGAPSNGDAWSAGDCRRRVLRGGGWSDGSRRSRSAFRSGFPTTTRDDSLGFRIARTLD
jgi:formylglycine-generating enzyme required for sulfatase activity